MLKKFRTSRGFGVHSPFAFAFIQNVLRAKAGYYPYAEISHLLDLQGISTPYMERFSRLLLRLAVYFRPEKIVAQGDGMAGLDAIIRLAAENSGNEPSDIPMLVCLHPLGSDGRLSEEIRRWIAPSGPSLALIGLRKVDPVELMEQTGVSAKEKTEGMTFISPGRYMVFVNLPHLPRQDFTLSF